LPATRPSRFSALPGMQCAVSRIRAETSSVCREQTRRSSNKDAPHAVICLVGRTEDASPTRAAPCGSAAQPAALDPASRSAPRTELLDRGRQSGIATNQQRLPPAIIAHGMQIAGRVPTDRFVRSSSCPSIRGFVAVQFIPSSKQADRGATRCFAGFVGAAIQRRLARHRQRAARRVSGWRFRSSGFALNRVGAENRLGRQGGTIAGQRLSFRAPASARGTELAPSLPRPPSGRLQAPFPTYPHTTHTNSVAESGAAAPGG